MSVWELTSATHDELWIQGSSWAVCLYRFSEIPAFIRLWLYQLWTKSPKLLRLDVPEFTGSLKPGWRCLNCHTPLSRNWSGKRWSFQVSSIHRLHVVNDELSGTSRRFGRWALEPRGVWQSPGGRWTLIYGYTDPGKEEEHGKQCPAEHFRLRCRALPHFFYTCWAQLPFASFLSPAPA